MNKKLVLIIICTILFIVTGPTHQAAADKLCPPVSVVQGGYCILTIFNLGDKLDNGITYTIDSPSELKTGGPVALNPGTYLADSVKEPSDDPEAGGWCSARIKGVSGEARASISALNPGKPILTLPCD